MSDCPLCRGDGGLLLFRDEFLRLVRVQDTPDHPAFYRLILNAHVAEFSQLAAAERGRLMEALALVECLLIRELRPAKVNLASLGNVVPHLHWHVIARFADDAQFPAPIWAPAQRHRDNSALEARLPALDQLLRAALGEAQSG